MPIGDPEESKCKKYKWYIVGVVVIGLIGLIIGLTAGHKDDGPQPGPPGPSPGPGPGPTPAEFNPYHVEDDSTIVQTIQTVSGFLIANPQKVEQMKNFRAVQDDPLKIKAEPQAIPQGENNKLMSNVSFEFA